MKPETAARLLALNRRFYEELAEPFAVSRDYYHPGFARLRAFLPRPCRSLLDIGCGEGRLGRYLLSVGAIEGYVGVDFSAALLERAARTVAGRFLEVDLSQPGSLRDLGKHPAVACISTLQHIPGRANRARLLAELGERLEPEGVLFLADWQFIDHDRQRRKIVSWAEAGIAEEDVEENDYLLSWERGARGRRYVCLIDDIETARLAEVAGLTVIDQFRSDGREGDLNLYTIMRRASGELAE